MSVWRSIAIVINALTFSAETEIDYLVTNAVTDKATAQWIVRLIAHNTIAGAGL